MMDSELVGMKRDVNNKIYLHEVLRNILLTP